jgi:hypothetical protein
MRVPVLEDRHLRGFLDRIDEALVDERRNDGQRHRNLGVRSDFEETPERGRVATGVVIAAPKLCAPAARAPQVELVVER